MFLLFLNLYSLLKCHSSSKGQKNPILIFWFSNFFFFFFFFCSQKQILYENKSKIAFQINFIFYANLVYFVSAGDSKICFINYMFVKQRFFRTQFSSTIIFLQNFQKILSPKSLLITPLSVLA